MKRSLTRRAPLFVTMLTAALIVVGWRVAGAGPCIRDGLTCRTNDSCCSGVCVKSSKKSFGTCCSPTTCAAVGANCGMIADGCGGTLDCGTCTLPQTCGGGGTPNVCGCSPTTCLCGNNVFDPGKTCDGTADSPFCSSDPVTANRCVACQCCGSTDHRCSPEGTCCDPRDACTTGSGVAACTRTCTTSSDCGGGGTTAPECENGLCCVPLGSPCAALALGIHDTCCGGNACAAPVHDAVGTVNCCIPTGEPCTDSSTCCSGSCNVGTSTCD
jgi:hypothetical protein